MNSKFSDEIAQHIADAKLLDLSTHDLVTSILLSAGKYSDTEIENAIDSLDLVILNEIKDSVFNFRKTGEYHIISSTGTSRDISKLMARLSVILQN
ncbi:hypothetical protein [Lysobacter sp. Root690]|uniref:hypothetical protein n=1 Tax=Lysobacter sp. Root690 TaxID=1736588 RepID=UPI0012FBE0AC|nr:hypothetical protein [Lysobacter sp. Root690]